ncbi:hypothetical protein [Photobacterium profundum]|uniref:Uncharacterized protein n=1 Tax=Photobacterium profundum (strain SS9) TaxID=298386 RepID=Q6LGU2_PHOPR|nr:hypothetical protein [Photobacterium profundum]CAG23488.1 Hypothetical protein PBPRB1628 [Photobacterium profundum SS9]
MSDKTNKAKEKLRKEITSLLQAEFGGEVLDDEPILQIALSNTAVFEVLIDKISQYQETREEQLLASFSLIEEKNASAFDDFLREINEIQKNTLAVQQKAWFDSANQLLKKHLIKTETLLNVGKTESSDKTTLFQALSMPLLLLLSISNIVLLLMMLYQQ